MQLDRLFHFFKSPEFLAFVKSQKALGVIGLVIIALGLGATVLLLQQRQDTRSHAATRNGLTATYYSAKGFVHSSRCVYKDRTVTKLENRPIDYLWTEDQTEKANDDICFNFNPNDPKFGSYDSADDFSIRWEGWIMPPYSGTYTFRIDSDDAAGLWVNNVRLFQKSGSCICNESGTIYLTQGQPVRIKIEFENISRSATIHLRWAISGKMGEQIVPAAYLYENTSQPPPSFATCSSQGGVCQYSSCGSGQHSVSGQCDSTYMVCCSRGPTPTRTPTSTPRPANDGYPQNCQRDGCCTNVDDVRDATGRQDVNPGTCIDKRSYNCGANGGVLVPSDKWLCHGDSNIVCCARIIQAPTATPTSSPTPTVTPTPTATPTPGITTVKFDLLLHGIGDGGDNQNEANSAGGGNNNPRHFQRPIQVQLVSQQKTYTLKNGVVTYNRQKGSFVGEASFKWGDEGFEDFENGNYTVWVKFSQSKNTLASRDAKTITSGEVHTIPQFRLTTGDITNDGVLDVADYEQLLLCYSDFDDPARECTSAKKEQADITDDGKVNFEDLSLLLRELSSN